MKNISGNINSIRNAVNDIKNKAGGSKNVEILAVTKTFPWQDVCEALKCEIKGIAESKIQEALAKFELLGSRLDEISKHFIGHLQSNKVKKAVENFDLIQSLDSFKLAQDIDRHAKNINKIQSCLIEVKVSKEDSKTGIPFEEVEELYSYCLKLPNVSVNGLMTITPLNCSPQSSRLYFKSVFGLFEKIRLSHAGNEFNILSMGMSDDYKIAVEEGSNMIRIGSAIFGERDYGNK
ncbi:MAG: YggS family pyridoxal phosphate-dependent enzyme [Endomicrobium sp.]|jgi:pyridoxal phosphate enzyme (YggS family)|nr:YggS family pyridoxal phosphate-dependent enzyme [Endomicrobium sp.]